MEEKPELASEQDVDADAEVSDEGTLSVDRDVDIQTGGVSVERPEDEVEPEES